MALQHTVPPPSPSPAHRPLQRMPAGHWPGLPEQPQAPPRGRRPGCPGPRSGALHPSKGWCGPGMHTPAKPRAPAVIVA